MAHRPTQELGVTPTHPNGASLERHLASTPSIAPAHLTEMSLERRPTYLSDIAPAHPIGVSLDPTDIVCRLYDSLQEGEPLFGPEVLPLWFGQAELGNVEPTACVDETQLILLKQLETAITTTASPANGPQPIELVDPYASLNNSIFSSREGLKMANIDAIYHFSGYMPNTSLSEIDMTLQDTQQPVYVSLGSNGFVEYMQFRQPHSKGYGLTTKDHDWNIRRVNFTRFTSWYAQIQNKERTDEFAASLLDTNNEGFDLVMGYHVAAEAKLPQLDLLLKLSKAGGNLMMRVDNLSAESDCRLTYSLALAFERIVLFKPVSSSPLNPERYLIAWNRRAATKVSLARNLLEQKKILVSKSFIGWLTTENTTHLARQIEARQVAARISRGEEIPRPIVNLQKCHIIWSLPDRTQPQLAKSEERFALPLSASPIPLSEHGITAHSLFITLENPVVVDLVETPLKPENCQIAAFRRIHQEQRRSALALVQALCLMKQRVNRFDFTVLYIGNPGSYLSVVNEMMPGPTYQVFNSLASQIEAANTIQLQNRDFTDQDASNWATQKPSLVLLFVDRAGASLAQQWVKTITASLTVVRLRPITNDKGMRQSNFDYFPGRLLAPIWASPCSEETYLVVLDVSQNITYDLKQYHDRLYHQNAIVREGFRYSNPFQQFVKEKLDNSWDGIAEITTLSWISRIWNGTAAQTLVIQQTFQYLKIFNEKLSQGKSLAEEPLLPYQNIATKIMRGLYRNAVARLITTKIYKTVGYEETLASLRDMYQKYHKATPEPVDHDVVAQKAARSVVDLLHTVLQPEAIPAGLNYLDVGANDCSKAYHIGQGIAAGSITGVDAYDNYSKSPYAQTNACQFIQLKDSILPFPDNSFQLVTALMTLHHVEDIATMLDEISRVLAPGGILLIREHDGYSEVMGTLVRFEHDVWREVVESRTSSQYDEEEYIKLFRKEEWKELLANRGLVETGLQYNIDFLGNPTANYYAVYRSLA
jgi:ubiquinone/menaquinone biosynthesis C-methylase UbiE